MYMCYCTCTCVHVCTGKCIYKAVVTVKLKDGFNKNYQNHNCACADTHGNYRDTKFVTIIISIAKKYDNNR